MANTVLETKIGCRGTFKLFGSFVVILHRTTAPRVDFSCNSAPVCERGRNHLTKSCTSRKRTLLITSAGANFQDAALKGAAGIFFFLNTVLTKKKNPSGLS